MTRFANGRTVQRIPFVSKGRDAHRAEVVNRGTPYDVHDAGFDPDETSEVDGRQVIQPAVLFVDPDVDTHPLDRWVVDGSTYEVVGHPTRVRNDFTGHEFDTEVQLRRVVG